MLVTLEVAEKSWLAEARPIIDECFSKRSVEEIISALETSNTDFGNAAVETMRKRCPLSLKVRRGTLDWNVDNGECFSEISSGRVQAASAGRANVA
jgi:hypothetical protein